MIKPEDLRIGDLVHAGKDCAFPKGTLCIVTNILSTGVFMGKKGVVALRVVNDNNDGPLEAWCCNVEYIPITSEIFRKNGFEEEIGDLYFSKPIDNEKVRSTRRRHLIIERNGNAWTFLIHSYQDNSVLRRKVKYVHELQHILWVLGLDAELKL